VDFRNSDPECINFRIQSLQEKLITWAEFREDDIVFVLPDKSLERLEGTGIKGRIRKNVEGVDSDVTVEFTTHEEI